MMMVSTGVQTRKNRLKPIRCPCCGKGRICDTSVPCAAGPPGEDPAHGQGICIILKCRICGTPISLTIE